MARPRLSRLPAEQLEQLRRAARSEFAGHGFAGASLNRIIETAGISKGSLYYYFDSKEDLYAQVVRDALAALIEHEGPFETPNDSADPEQFWTLLGDHYLRLTRALLDDPELASLVRGWIAAAGNPTMLQVQRELEQTALPWLVTVLASGQRIGAVRTDLPADLLLAVVLGMGQAMDVWLIGSRTAGEPPVLALEEAVPALVGMIRRAVQP